MTGFVLAACAMLGGALLTLLPPLAARGVAAPRAHKPTVAALAFGLPALALGLYALLGQPAAIGAAAATKPGDSAVAQDIETMVETLARRLEAKPDDAAGWLMLARSYNALQRFAEAARAYSRAAALQPADAQLLADQADALAMAQGKRAAGEPTRLIEAALALDANNLKALALAGSAAWEHGDRASARRFWQRALELAPADSGYAQALRRQLDATASVP